MTLFQNDKEFALVTVNSRIKKISSTSAQFGLLRRNLAQIFPGWSYAFTIEFRGLRLYPYNELLLKKYNSRVLQYLASAVYLFLLLS